MKVVCLNEAAEKAYAVSPKNWDYYFEKRETPWRDEGEQFFWFEDGEGGSAQATWGWNDLNISKVKPARVISDFYLLDAIASGVLRTEGQMRPMSYNWEVLKELFKLNSFKEHRNPDNDPLIAVMEEGLEAFANHVVQYAEVFRMYSWYAITSEVRHSNVLTNSKSIHADFAVGRCKAVRAVCEHYGYARTALWFAALFHNPEKEYGYWKSSYGGKPWGDAARVLAMYEKRRCEGMPFGEREFLDRVFSLRHNTNTFLDKWEWDGWGTSDVSQVLDAHNNSDWLVLSGHASVPVRKLFKTYRELEEGTS